MTESPEMQTQLVSSHGMLAILEVLEGRCSRDVIMKLLQIINLVSLLTMLICTRMRRMMGVVGDRRCWVFGELLFDWVRRFYLE